MCYSRGLSVLILVRQRRRQETQSRPRRKKVCEELGGFTLQLNSGLQQLLVTYNFPLLRSLIQTYFHPYRIIKSKQRWCRLVY